MFLDLTGAIELGFAAALAIGAIAVCVGSGLRQRVLIAGPLLAWLIIVIALGGTGTFYAPPSAPADERLGALARFGLAIVGPVIVLSAAFISVTWLRERLRAMPVSNLIAVHAIRLLGISFLVLYSADRLPAPFAPVAGWGDIIAGLAAIPVALMAASKPAESRTLILGWNIYGLADLVIAIGLGVTSNLAAQASGDASGTMTSLPWLLIPAFLVPLLATTHMAIFYKLRNSPRAAHGIAALT